MTAAAPLDLAPERPRALPVVALERLVLGALLVGSLLPADVRDLDDAFRYQHHAAIFAVLVSALELRAEGHPVPGRKGLDLAWAIRACTVAGLCPVGATYVLSSGRTQNLGYLPQLAREAPRRRDALDAVAAVRRAAAIRYDVERDREVLGEALAEVVEDAAATFLRCVREQGGITCEGPSVRVGGDYERRWYVRGIEPGAIPPPGHVAAWINKLLAGGRPDDDPAWRRE